MTFLIKSLGLVLALLFTASLSFAAPDTIQVKAVEWIETNGEDINVSYRIPCGAKFLGYAISGTARLLQIGVAYRTGATKCLGIGAVTSEQLSWLKVPGSGLVKSVKTFNPRVKWQIKPMTNVQVLPYKSSQARLRAVVPGGCRSFYVTLVRHKDDKKVEVASLVAENISFKANQASKCQHSDEAKIIPAVSLDKEAEVSTLRRGRKALHKAYSLRLTTIRSKSVRRIPGGGVSFTYQRACNEAPIGAVLRKIPNGKSGFKVGVGMLVARYYNLECLSGEPRKLWSKFSDRSIRLPLSSRVVRLKSIPTSEKIIVRQPGISDLLQGQRKLGLILDYHKSCKARVGVVYSKDLYGQLAVGVVERQGDKTCNPSPNKVSLYQPFLTHNGARKAAYPLTLNGL